jgi:gamma-glutamylcysteine synthetase
MDYLENRFFDIEPFNLIGISEDIQNWLKEKDIKIQIK